jgi:hypothetical protein
MLNRSRSRWIAVVSLAALLGAAGIAVAGDEGRHGRRPGKRIERVVKHRRARVLRAMERLDALSDEQAKVALDASRDLARIREEVRSRSAAVVLQAFREAKASPDKREAIREATRARIRALRGEFRAPFLEAGMKIVRSLTPEQRTRIEEAGKKHDRKVTDERLAKRFGSRLSHPWAQALLKARIEGTK